MRRREVIAELVATSGTLLARADEVIE